MSHIRSIYSEISIYNSNIHEKNESLKKKKNIDEVVLHNTSVKKKCISY